MADVTISGLTEITATGNSVVPISQNNTTYKTSVSSITNTVGLQTDSFKIPAGTTDQRPPNPQAGFIRFNTTLKTFEFYNGTAWSTDSYTAEVLLVGGGGGAGGYGGAGGGAGGFVDTVISIFPGQNYPLVVGTGGPASTVGNNTIGFNYTAFGGGFGNAYGAGGGVGGNGGSGGGGAGSSNTSSYAGGQGVAGQGNNGGVGGHNYGSGAAGGGGGGASSGGANWSGPSGPGAGGAGKTWKGLATVYCAGGNGTSTNFGNNGVGASGAANTGNGGSAGNNGGGSGGSGIIRIRYTGTQRGTGGTITTPGDGYTYHTFTSTGNNIFIG